MNSTRLHHYKFHHSHSDNTEKVTGHETSIIPGNKDSLLSVDGGGDKHGTPACMEPSHVKVVCRISDATKSRRARVLLYTRSWFYIKTKQREAIDRNEQTHLSIWYKILTVLCFLSCFFFLLFHLSPPPSSATLSSFPPLVILSLSPFYFSSLSFSYFPFLFFLCTWVDNISTLAFSSSFLTHSVFISSSVSSLSLPLTFHLSFSNFFFLFLSPDRHG